MTTSSVHLLGKFSSSLETWKVPPELGGSHAAGKLWDAETKGRPELGLSREFDGVSAAVEPGPIILRFQSYYLQSASADVEQKRPRVYWTCLPAGLLGCDVSHK